MGLTITLSKYRYLEHNLFLLLDIFSNICNLPLKENKISIVPEIVDSFLSGILKISFICQLCQETNIYYEPFHHIPVQPNTDIFSYLAINFHENKNLTCRKCTTQSCQSSRTSYQETPNILLIQINRFSVSNLHGRPRKNNHPFGIYENIKLGLINYTLLGLIDHHGVSLTLAIMSVTSDKITSGTIVMINTLQKLIYPRCQIMFILCFTPRDRYRHIGI